jgi:hypothetical protein
VLTFPFYYRNGRLNFLEPISFAVENQNEKQDEVRRLLYKHFLLREAPDHRDAHLLVVAHPPLNGEPRDQEKFQRCLRMLSENEVETQIVERDQEESWRRLVEHVKSDLGVRD